MVCCAVQCGALRCSAVRCCAVPCPEHGRARGTRLLKHVGTPHRRGETLVPPWAGGRAEDADGRHPARRFAVDLPATGHQPLIAGAAGGLGGLGGLGGHGPRGRWRGNGARNEWPSQLMTPPTQGQAKARPKPRPVDGGSSAAQGSAALPARAGRTRSPGRPRSPHTQLAPGQARSLGADGGGGGGARGLDASAGRHETARAGNEPQANFRRRQAASCPHG